MSIQPRLAPILATLALLAAFLGSSTSTALAAPDTNHNLLNSSSMLLLDEDDEETYEGMDGENEDDEQDEDEEDNESPSGTGMIIGSIGIASAVVIALAFISQSAGDLLEKVRIRQGQD